MTRALAEAGKNLRIVMDKVDIVIIGSGPGGYVAAIRAAQLGLSTIVVEKAETGGICLNWGCIPTKALLKSAQALHYLKKSKEYGIEIEGEIKVNISSVVERSRGVAATMSKGVDYLLKKSNIKVVKGFAKITGIGEVTVTADDGLKEVLYCKNIIIATGASANYLPFAVPDGDKIITYRNALVPVEVPSRLAIIGSGAIGSEFAYFYRAMGSEVTLIEYLDNIVPLEDEEVSSHLSRAFRKSGIKVLTGTNVTAVEKNEEGVKITAVNKKGTEVIVADKVLIATGIKPNIEGIGLEELGITVERGRIVVDNLYKTSVSGIFAIGDVINTPALAHVASAEGVKCVELIAGLNPHPVNYDSIPSCIYTSPEIASVGLSEKRAKERGIEVTTGKFPFTASGKAAASGERDGFVKLVVEASTDRVVGAHLIGANVTEIIAGIVTAMNLGVKAKDIINSIHPHPTMSEAVMEAAAAIHNEVIHL